MSPDELAAFEAWLMTCYTTNDTVPYAVLAKVLKLVRANVGK